MIDSVSPSYGFSLSRVQKCSYLPQKKSLKRLGKLSLVITGIATCVLLGEAPESCHCLRGSTSPVRRSLYTGTVNDLGIDSQGELIGRNAELFTDLDGYSRGVKTWKAIQPDFNVYIQTKEGAYTSDNQTGAADIFKDSAFNKTMAAHIDDAILAFTWSLTEWRDGILDMGYFEAKKGIALNQSELSLAIGRFFKSTLAIGGFENNSTVHAAGFTYGEVDSDGASKLYSINLLSRQFSLDETVGYIFHEVLHNFGFMHGSNALDSYKDRSVAILALEDMMASFIQYFVRDKCPPDDILQDCSIFDKYPVAGRQVVVSTTKIPGPVEGNEDEKRKTMYRNAAVGLALATVTLLGLCFTYMRHRREQELMTVRPYLYPVERSST